MGFRFQKRISILPGVRINLSKSGVSTSLGPRGADVNIGKDGVTANAGIPGTGLSYRQKLGGGAPAKAGWLGVLAVICGLGFWAFHHAGKVEKALAPVRQEAAQVIAPPGSTVQPAPVNTGADSVRYVHRAGSVLRAKPKTSAESLKKEMKGTQVTLLSETSDGWAQVKDGELTGYMRSSVLGAEPPD
jgi:uncharacterized protein YgiM (DUF1202 family)